MEDHKGEDKIIHRTDSDYGCPLRIALMMTVLLPKNVACILFMQNSYKLLE